MALRGGGTTALTRCSVIPQAWGTILSAPGTSLRAAYSSDHVRRFHARYASCWRASDSIRRPRAVDCSRSTYRSSPIAIWKRLSVSVEEILDAFILDSPQASMISGFAAERISSVSVLQRKASSIWRVAPYVTSPVLTKAMVFGPR